MTTAQLTVQINGVSESIKQGTTIQSLLLERRINSNLVACELNNKVIRRAELDKIVLKEGDALEVIRMMGGG